MAREEPTDWTDLIRNLIEETAPERRDDIGEMWATYQPRVLEVDGRSGVVMNADAKAIRFARKDTQLIWLIGFSCWRAIETYAPAALLADAGELPALKRADIDLPELEYAYVERFAAIRNLLAASEIEPADWPPDIPTPVVWRHQLDSIADRAVYDIVMMATATIVMHEFRHVMFRQDKSGPSDWREEELACDVFARDFLSAKLAAYAAVAGHDYEKALTKRSLGFALAALFLSVVTPDHGRGGTDEYPPLAVRLDALIRTAALKPWGHFWICISCMLLGEAKRLHVDVSAVDTRDPERMAKGLLDLLNPPALDP